MCTITEHFALSLKTGGGCPIVFLYSTIYVSVHGCGEGT